ncbi:MAG: hypothetical protein Q4F38_06340 [Akkermansia sp.]|nr:hypothetical protein [Akkermansia sp.]
MMSFTGKSIIGISLLLLAVGCDNPEQEKAERVARNAAEVARSNAAYREHLYHSHVSRLRQECAGFLAALDKAVRAELLHADCGAGDCWCNEKQVPPVSVEGADFDALKSQLAQVKPPTAPNRKAIAPDCSEVYTLDENGDIIPSPTEIFVPPPSFGPADNLVFYDAEGKKLCELCIWSINPASKEGESYNIYDAYLLPDAEFSRLFEQPVLRHYIERMPEWAQERFR